MTAEGIVERAVKTIDFYKGVTNLRSSVERPFEQLV